MTVLKPNASWTDDSNSLRDLADSLLDLGDFVAVSLLPEPLGWLCLMVWCLVFGATIGPKRRVLRPYLEKKYKAEFFRKVRLRRRRLRETLNDPVLASDLKRRIRGTPEQVSQAMDRLRTTSEQEVDDDEDCSRGEEKKLAATAILYGTLCLCIIVATMNYFFDSYITQSEDPFERLIRIFFFLFVHMGDSYLLYHKTARKNKRHGNAPSSRSIDEGGSDDLTKPLLSTNEGSNDDDSPRQDEAI